MKSEKISIQGMSCGHCIMALKKELEKLPVTIKDIKVGSAELEYDETKISYKDIENAINEAGYLVEEKV